MILITVSQQRIGRSDRIQEIERALRQTHIVDINQVEIMAIHCESAPLSPLVLPGRARYDARILGALLVVERHGKLRRGHSALLVLIGQKWRLELGESDAHLARILSIPVVDEAIDLAREALIT